MSLDLDAAAVYADFENFDEPGLMGVLSHQKSRTGDIFSFEYDADWLRQPQVLTLDPDLVLVAGRQYPAAGPANFGIFLDSSPDRWGRVLMQRHENIHARRAGRRPRFRTPEVSSIAIMNLPRHRSLRSGNRRPLVFNLKRMRMKKSILTMSVGSVHCSPRGLRSVERAQKPQSETRTDGSASLAINEVDTYCHVRIALEAHAHYGLSKAEAESIVWHVTAAVDSWRREATKLRIPKSEQD